MRYILIVLLLASCTKDIPSKEQDGLSLQFGGKTYFYSNPVITREPFCNKMLFSISGNNDPSGRLLISVVTDSLHPGSYAAGLTYWGKISVSNDVVINVVSTEHGHLSATFAGQLTSGVLRNVPLN
ncbi:MAG: hypothetical protein ACM3VS_17650 [Candidatus Dadabacteria bacterium]